MSPLKGLKKGERRDVEQQADDFIKGAALRVEPVPRRRTRAYQRYTFSLTQEVSREIDRLSLVPREFRATRSDIVRAGIQMLSELPEEQLIAIIKSVKAK